MYLKEISNQKWKVSANLKVDKIRLASLSRPEKEMIINLVEMGYTYPDEEEVRIHCSIPKWITKLSKNPNFVLESVLISFNLPNKNDWVLSVGGCLVDSNGITIKTIRKQMKLSSLERERRRERLTKMRAEQK